MTARRGGDRACRRAPRHRPPAGATAGASAATASAMASATVSGGTPLVMSWWVRILQQEVAGLRVGGVRRRRLGLAPDRREDGAGLHDDDPDAERGDLGLEGLADRLHRELGGRVRRHERWRQDGRRRRDVDDAARHRPPASPAAPPGCSAPRPARWCRTSAGRRRRGLLDAAGAGDAGVVDQHRDRPAGEDLDERRRDRRVVGDVEQHGVHVGARRPRPPRPRCRPGPRPAGRRRTPRYPSAARRSAVASPIPELAPVTTAVSPPRRRSPWLEVSGTVAVPAQAVVRQHPNGEDGTTRGQLVRAHHCGTWGRVLRSFVERTRGASPCGATPPHAGSSGSPPRR